jgi:hypothetical protein
MSTGNVDSQLLRLLRVHRDAGKKLRIVEYIVYSDCWFLGNLDGWDLPFQIDNLVPAFAPQNATCPRLVLRLIEYGELADLVGSGDLSTDESRFSGESLHEEILSFASLVLGSRLVSGGTFREFSTDTLDFGRPDGMWCGNANTGHASSRGHARAPRLLGQRDLTQLAPRFARFRDAARPLSAMTVARVARLFRTAAWYAEVEPDVAWVLLVSALEKAAAAWDLSKHDRTQVFRAEHSDLARRVEACGPDLLDSVAELVVNRRTLGKRLQEFIATHCEAPSGTRQPGGVGSVNWTPQSLREIGKFAYDARSKYLHEGKPFPPAVSEPPLPMPENNSVRWTQRPCIGLAQVQASGRWATGDLPILLDAFFHVAQNSLSNWIASAGDSTPDELPQQESVGGM